MTPLSEPEDHILKVEGYGSPVTIIAGKATDEVLSFAASLCARYSDAKHLPEIDVTASMKNERYYLKVKPASNEILERCRIEKKPSALVFNDS